LNAKAVEKAEVEGIADEDDTDVDKHHHKFDNSRIREKEGKQGKSESWQ